MAKNADVMRAQISAAREVDKRAREYGTKRSTEVLETVSAILANNPSAIAQYLNNELAMAFMEGAMQYGLILLGDEPTGP